MSERWEQFGCDALVAAGETWRWKAVTCQICEQPGQLFSAEVFDGEAWHSTPISSEPEFVVQRVCLRCAIEVERVVREAGERVGE